MDLGNKRVWIAAAVVIAVPVLVVAWRLISPLFIDKTVEEEFPFAHSAVVPVDMTRNEVEDTMAVMAKMDSPETDAMPKEMADPQATALKKGDFEDADDAHRGEGTATVYRLPDGSHVLRVEQFKVTNGPDLRVIMSPNSDPQSSSEVTESGYVELGKLKGNIGNQNYPFPEGVDPATFNSVVIYCKPFRVLFSVARLQ